MKRQPRVTRRRFLGATAATAGGMWMLGSPTLAAVATGDVSDFPSTDHFWYRPQPAGPFVDSQRDNKAFGFADGKVFLSEDNGRTWPHSIAFPDARHIVFSCILKNGNILFSALAKLYLSTDNLKTYRQITVKNADGSDYVPHTPQNPDHPAGTFTASRASTRGM